MTLTIVKTSSFASTPLELYLNGVHQLTSYVGGGSERIEGINHDTSLIGSSIDVGGPMILQRTHDAHTACLVKTGTRKGSTYYVPGAGISGRPSMLTDTQVKGQGATAIARTTPTNPIVDSTTAVGEAMMGGLPALGGVSAWREKAAVHRGLGSEYLNVQFGWLPFVSDIRNFAYAAKNTSEILREFRAGSGKNTRVGYHFPENKSSWSNSRSITTIRADGIQGETVSCTEGGSAGSKMWFNGAFTYHIPMGNDQASKMQRFEQYANKLYGTRLTPEVLWNLAPWSWALDWFGNTGDVLSNLSALGNDGLVLKYGYMMYHNYGTSYRVTKPGSVMNSGSCYRISETKKRFGASPYRMFTEGGSLSTTQLAVITALGLSKA